MGGVFMLLRKEMLLAEKPFLQGEGGDFRSTGRPILAYATFTKILLMILFFNTMYI